MFEKYGNVAYISLPKFKSGTIKRFAFVEFEDEASAKKIVEVKLINSVINSYQCLFMYILIPMKNKLILLILFQEHKKQHEEPKILPENLQSIITFNEDENKKDMCESDDSVNLVRKRKHSINTNYVKEKKMKKEVLQVSSLGVKNNKKKKKRDKNKKSDIENEKKESSFEISDNENNQKATLNEQLDSSIGKSEEIMPSDDDNKTCNIESNNVDGLIKKKKRKRNKGKKGKSNINATITPGLRIMSK